MEPKTAPQKPPHERADDILKGAEAVAEFLFGSGEFRRKVYYLVECSRLPVFRLCARKSVLLKYILSQEERALSEES